MCIPFRYCRQCINCSLNSYNITHARGAGQVEKQNDLNIRALRPARKTRLSFWCVQLARATRNKTRARRYAILQIRLTVRAHAYCNYTCARAEACFYFFWWSTRVLRDRFSARSFAREIRQRARVSWSKTTERRVIWTFRRRRRLNAN